MVETNIYILSHLDVKGQYKLGITKNPLEALYKRYRTPIPRNKVHYFIKYVDAKVVEQKLLKKYSDVRVINTHSGSPSEWLKVELHELVTDLFITLINNQYGRDNKGIFIIDDFIKSIERGTTVLEADGYGIAKAKVIPPKAKVVPPKAKVVPRKDLETFIQEAKEFETAAFHRGFKNAYPMWKNLSPQKIRATMNELGWCQVCINNNRKLYKKV